MRPQRETRAEATARQMPRRDFLGRLGAGALGGAMFPSALHALGESPTKPITLGMSLYGLKSLKIEEALPLLAKIGYDAVEFCLAPSSQAMPAALTLASCKPLRRLLQSTGLRLSALMENLSLSAGEKEQRAARERLKYAAALAHALCPESPPLVETVAGNGQWGDLCEQVRDHLAEWARVAEAEKIMVAIKPHRGQVLDRPENAVWLVQQVASRWIGLNYDYSHFAHRGIPLEASLRLMLPYTRFIHVKDWVEHDCYRPIVRRGRPLLRPRHVSWLEHDIGGEFVLPGESHEIDYAALVNQVRQFGYCGDVCCQVSALVFNKEGYDPVAAARTCYQNMAPAFEAAG
jgi:sugar phosphate isomerase/epimerase